MLLAQRYVILSLAFFNYNYSRDNVNTTFITLIPKLKNDVKVKDFRPISLCNVVYKIVAKVLANRLQSMLQNIISPNQHAFIPGRLIFDNTLIAYEVLHSMTSRCRGRARYMDPKLDMSKTYDLIEWPFLEAVLLKMGFHANWIKLIMICISIFSYSTLINGNL